MKYRFPLAAAVLPLLVACGGGGDGAGGNTVEVDPNRDNDNNNNQTTILTEDRTRPDAGTYSTVSTPIKDNGTNAYANEGPQHVYGNGAPSSEGNQGEGLRQASWPGLRYGDFLLTNNPWNAGAATYEDWYQTIELNPQGNDIQAVIDWDWGAAADTRGSPFNTKSYPEVIYGTKSVAERSGNFQETGLPVEHYDMPEWTIEYEYSYQGRRSSSLSGGGSDSEFNIAIESFYHESCDIKRTGAEDDNQIMEVMVWLKYDQNLPAGNAPYEVPFTTSDGRVFDVYPKSSNFNYVAYVAREEQSSGTILYGEILQDAKDKADVYGIYPIKDTDCLANILFGPEIWHGAGTFTLSNYKINRTY
jgi:hypothetical protein